MAFVRLIVSVNRGHVDYPPRYGWTETDRVAITDKDGVPQFEIANITGSSYSEKWSLRAAGGRDLAVIQRYPPKNGFEIVVGRQPVALVYRRLFGRYRIHISGEEITPLGSVGAGGYVLKLHNEKILVVVSRSGMSYRRVMVEINPDEDLTIMLAVALAIEALREERTSEFRIGFKWYP